MSNDYSRTRDNQPPYSQSLELQNARARVKELERELSESKKENDMLRQCNAQSVTTEQSIRNEANYLRGQVRRLKGRIANALL